MNRDKKISHMWMLPGAIFAPWLNTWLNNLPPFCENGAGIDLRQFARKVGISDSTLHRMEMGQQNVTLKP